MGLWDTQSGVPNQAGVILQGSLVSFTLWMRKSAKWGTVFPRAELFIHAPPH
jgi:hypothetical protein